MSAYNPISPRAAVQLLKSADVGVDCERLLADLAEAGSVKGYARLVETMLPGQAATEVRDGRIPRAIWKRVGAEDKVAEVYTAGSVRLGHDDGDASGRVSVLGIRFDERSVRAAAAEHGRALSPVQRAPAGVPTPKAAPQATPAPPSVSTPAPALPPASRRALAEDTVAVSIDDAAALLGLSRGTIYKMIDAGTVVSKKVGGRRLVAADSLRALLPTR